jgi:hypothetical protein
MRLIAKTRDYYDSAIGFGIDPNIVYNRKEEEFKKAEDRFAIIGDEFTLAHTAFPTIINEFFLIVFCGKVYPVYQHEYRLKNPKYADSAMKTRLVYDKKEMYRLWQLGYSPGYWADKVYNFINKQYDEKKTAEFQHTIGIPYLMITSKSVVYNPILKDYNFYRVYDSYAAFQEISMFISGVLGGQSPPMVQLTDKDLIAKRGFNELSFRKQKETK